MKSNNTNNQIQKGYVTTDVASEATGYTPKQIRKFRDSASDIRFIKLDNRRLLVHLGDLKKYKLQHDAKRRDVVWGDMDASTLSTETFRFVFGYDLRYAVSSSGTVYNATDGNVVKGYVRKDGYVMVSLRKDGKDVPHFVHRLVGEHWCEHTCKNQHYHHLDRNKENNDYKNLIAVNEGEHRELHTLSKNGMEYTCKRRLYEIQKTNETKTPYKLYDIPHPDYESNDKVTYTMQVDARGYDDYINGEEVSASSIWGEYAAFTEDTKEVITE